MTHHAQHTQAIKRRQRRTTSVQRHDVMHLQRVFTALLAPPVLSPQLRDPQQRPLAGGINLTPDDGQTSAVNPLHRRHRTPPLTVQRAARQEKRLRYVVTALVVHVALDEPDCSHESSGFTRATESDHVSSSRDPSATA